MAVGGVFGLVPVAQARRAELDALLRRQPGRGGTAGREQERLRSALMVGELALAVVLLVGAGRSGVESAAVAGAHPLDAGYTNSFTVVGREAEAGDWPEISVRQITPGYLRTLGVPLLRGRGVEEGDAAGAPPVALINAAPARRFFAGREPLGERIAFWGSERIVVGVVGDERVLGALGLSRFLVGLLYGVGRADAGVLGGVALVLGAAAAPASYLPARRAARVAPSVALRAE